MPSVDTEGAGSEILRAWNRNQCRGMSAGSAKLETLGQLSNQLMQ